LAFWSSQINSCGSNANCIEAARINVAASFFLSIEFQESGFFAYRIYLVSFGNLASPTVPVPIRFTPFQTEVPAIKQGVIVGQGNWQAQLQANKVDFARRFVQRQSFLNAYPNLISATAFVDALNRNAGNVLSDSARTALISQLSVAPMDA